MAAANTDYFTEVGNPGTATTLAAPGHAIAGTSITVGSTSNWPTTTGAIFAIDTVTLVNGVEVRDVGSYTEWEGVVSSGTTVTSLVLRYGTDQNYPAGSTTRVYIPVASSRENRLTQGILVEHNQDGTHGDITATSITSSGATLTNPKIVTGINDTNGNELLKVVATGSAINEITVANAATGNGPTLSSTGGDANIDFNVNTKGTGVFKVGGNQITTGAWNTWTPTLGGFSVNPTGGIYKWFQTGRSVTLMVRMPNTGTSSATSITLTLPVTATTQAGMVWFGPVFDHVDNGAAQTTVGRAQILSAGTIVTLLLGANGSNWTAAGAKSASFTITYEI